MPGEPLPEPGRFASLGTFEVPPRLRADVRLLGETLGTVIREQAGESVYADVERLRELTLAACAGDVASSGDAVERAEKLIAGWPWEHAVVVARAFACSFHLTNLAEEHDRARSLSAFDAAHRHSAIGAAYQEARQSDAVEAAQMLGALEIHPVLTAHPTEARRRAVVAASQRVAELLVERDRSESGVEESFRRRLTEAVDRLWRTAIRRTSRPTPLDEVRTFMTVFDETLCGVVPEVYRRVEAVVAGDRSGLEPTGVPAFLRLGSWVGGDRDGNPSVTAEVTREAMAIQSEHVLLALERVCGRVGRALTLDERFTPPSRAVKAALARATTEHPQLMKQIATRPPGCRLSGREVEADRAGRGGLRPLRQPRDRGSPPRAGGCGHHHGIDALVRLEGGSDRRAVRLGAPTRLGRESGVPRTRGDRGIPRVVRAGDAACRDRTAAPGLATGPTTGGLGVTAVGPARHPVGVRLVAGAREPARLVRSRHGAAGRIHPGSSPRGP